MRKGFAMLLCCCLLSVFVNAQQFSFSDLEKLRAMKTDGRKGFLMAHNFIEGEAKTQGDLNTIVYRCYTVLGDKPVIKTVTFVTSKKLFSTILEYGIYDVEEALNLKTWIQEHGYQQEEANVDGKAQLIYRSKKHLLRYYEEASVEPDNSKRTRFIFALEY